LWKTAGNIRASKRLCQEVWSLIRYDFQTTAGFEDGSPPESPAEPELDYLTASTLLASELSVSQTASPNPVVTGSNVTYTIVVANTGSSAASLVTVTDDLPATVSFVSCSATGGGVCGGSGNNRTISFPVLAGGNSATITLVANVTCALANGTLIDNTAAVSTPSPEQDPNNNSVTVTVTASNPPPVIRNASVSTPVIRPAPNHTLDSETVNYTVTDNCGPVTSSLSVTSNEPVNGLGDAPIKPPIG